MRFDHNLGVYRTYVYTEHELTLTRLGIRQNIENAMEDGLFHPGKKEYILF